MGQIFFLVYFLKRAKKSQKEERILSSNYINIYVSISIYIYIAFSLYTYIEEKYIFFSLCIFFYI